MVKTAKHRKELHKVLEELHLYKEKHGCADCRNHYPHYVLEFDHKPGFQKIDVVYRVLRNYGPEIENGIKDVLCQMLQDIIVHKIDDENMIFEIDYERYVTQIKRLLES